MRLRPILILLALLCLAAAPAMAQDPVKVDPKHYTLAFENDQVRVLRVHYGPHEKSVMHEHPALVVIPLSDAAVKFTYPDGKSEVRQLKANEATWMAAEKHLPENLSDKDNNLFVVELKGKAPAAKPSGGKSSAKAPAKKAGK
jgi:hypothetical protein